MSKPSFNRTGHTETARTVNALHCTMQHSSIRHSEIQHSAIRHSAIRHSAKRNCAAGFTLIELVISIALLTVIMSVAYSSLTAIVSSKAALDDGRDADLAANSLLLRMTRELGSIELKPSNGNLNPCPPSPPASASHTPVLGLRETLRNGERGDSISFIASNVGQYLPDGGTHTGLVQITYRVEEVSENPEAIQSYRMLREELPYPGPSKAKAGSNLPPGASPACSEMFRFALTERLTSLKFEYYDQQNQRWEDSIGSGSVPARARLVRFSIKLTSPLGIERLYASSVPIQE